MTEKPQQAGGNSPDLAEGYPSLAEVIAHILDDEAIPDRGVRRVEINCFASGDATYQVFSVDELEPFGGYWTKD